MQNHLKDQTSPYLLQHVNNPVDWYPWCEEAFEKAKREDKPIFLSIGYSTCHWCHVMAHESFEDENVGKILNQYFVSIKVDKEERPDLDSIYMAVCQAFTGSGGWPTTIFLTPEQKPFFAGTYFPKVGKFGQPGLLDLLITVHEKWHSDRESLLASADVLVSHLRGEKETEADGHQMASEPDNRFPADERNGCRKSAETTHLNEQLLEQALDYFKKSFDKEHGGFGRAPKFPMPHNLLFLMQYYEKRGDREALEMAEKTLQQMFKGGIFDHIGGGFSRYSTDARFLVPHFEKMLYDNALLLLAYTKAFEITENSLYSEVSEKTAHYILREMTSAEGGFYSAQDADSEGVEGKYYVFKPTDTIEILGGEIGQEFNMYYGITDEGNFEGKSIPNLLHQHALKQDFERFIPIVYDYRRRRFELHVDDKVLTSWNGLMIAAMCQVYRVTKDKTYLRAAVNAQGFILAHLCEKDVLYVSHREGRRGGKGFLDDYAFEIFALLALYQATWENTYLEKAIQFCDKVVADFQDEKQGGFFLYGKDNEQLIFRPKETYDGAVFSGNSAMAYNLVQLYYLTEQDKYGKLAEKQLQFMAKEAHRYPAGYAMFLVALSDYLDPPKKMTVVVKDKEELPDMPCRIGLSTIVRVLENPTSQYLLKNDKTTFYVCKGRACQPPVNELEEE
ncbi:MAG: thioredoxin domain-containing protein [Eubacterium sp.]|nr:thioredoxin domain-containing protein [Eubacterium sp.]